MRVISLILLLSTATVISCRTQRRDIPSGARPIVSDLKWVDSAANSFTEQVNAYDGTPTSATTVNNDANTLENAVKGATTDAQNSSVQSNSDGQSIATYVTNKLGPDLAAVCTAIINKKQQWAAHGLSASAAGYVSDLKADVDAYFTTVAGKLPTAAQQAQIKAALAKIDKACNSSSLS